VSRPGRADCCLLLALSALDGMAPGTLQRELHVIQPEQSAFVGANTVFNDFGQKEKSWANANIASGNSSPSSAIEK
jgi:hypothetical protein